MTPYSKIFDVFMGKINDREMENMYKKDPLLFQKILVDFLKSALPKFTYCVKDLTDRDDNLLEFNMTLTQLEIEILAILMLAEYFNPKINRDEYLLNRLGSKDYSLFSPTNQLKELKDLRKVYINEANLLMIEYYYRQGI